MKTQTDITNLEWHVAIARSARRRMHYIRWLSSLMETPLWYGMQPTDQDLIRSEVRLVLEQMTEGCKSDDHEQLP